MATDTSTKFRPVHIAIAVILLAALSVAGYRLYQSRSNNSSPQNSQTVQSPQTQTSTKPDSTSQQAPSAPDESLQMQTFTIARLQGWQVAERETDNDACSDSRTREEVLLRRDTKKIRLIMNDCGKDFGSDAPLELALDGDKLKVANRQPIVCNATEDELFCAIGNGELDLGGLAPASPAGNRLFVALNDVSQEDLSEPALADFYDVLESIVVK